MLLVFRFTILFSKMRRRMKLAYHITESLMVVDNVNKNVCIFLFHKQYIFDFSLCFLLGKGIKVHGRNYGKFHVYSLYF